VTQGGCAGGWWIRGADAPSNSIGYRCDWINHVVTLMPDGRLGTPKPLGDVSEVLAMLKGGTDQLADGRIIGILQGDDEAPPREFHVVLDWFSELEPQLAAERR